MVHSKNNNKKKVGIEILIPDAIEFKNTAQQDAFHRQWFVTLGVPGIPENLMKTSLLPRDGNTHTYTHNFREYSVRMPT